MGLNDLQSAANVTLEGWRGGAGKQLTKREEISESDVTHGYCILGRKQRKRWKIGRTGGKKMKKGREAEKRGY